jgi:hypothetical protein
MSVRARGTRFSTKISDLAAEEQEAIKAREAQESEIEKAREIVRRYEAMQPHEQLKILRNTRA